MIAPMKTGKVLGMKESYSEGLANHADLESCGDNGNVIDEALTEGSAGCVLSPERYRVLGADAILPDGRQYCINCYGEGYADLAGSETTCMHGNTLHWNRETLRLTFSDSKEVIMENPGLEHSHEA